MEIINYAPHFLFIALGMGALLMFVWGAWEFYKDIVEWKEERKNLGK